MDDDIQWDDYDDHSVQVWEKSDSEWVQEHMKAGKKMKLYSTSYVKGALFKTWARLRHICGENRADTRSDMKRLTDECVYRNLPVINEKGKKRTALMLFKVLLYHMSLVQTESGPRHDTADDTDVDMTGEEDKEEKGGGRGEEEEGKKGEEPPYGMAFIQRILHEFAARQPQRKKNATFAEWWELTMSKVLSKDIKGAPLHSKSVYSFLPGIKAVPRVRRARKKKSHTA